MNIRKPRKVEVLLTSAFLGAMTFALFAIGEAKLGRDRTLHSVAELGLWPGMLITALFYPQGAHTGRGISYFVYVVWACNVLFYAAIWFIILYFAHLERRQNDANGV